jgi:hypothetical protein
MLDKVLWSDDGKSRLEAVMGYHQPSPQGGMNGVGALPIQINPPTLESGDKKKRGMFGLGKKE